MVFQETVAEPEVEEEPPCLYCRNSFQVKVGVSCGVIGFFFFLSLGYLVWSRNQMQEKALNDALVVEEGKEETDNNELVGIAGTPDRFRLSTV